ncbi:MAG: hypothetical protein Q7J55_02575 [bacterium]|nr:hypothetical protein [bacterium]
MAKDKCDVCGKKLDGFFIGAYKCRICGRIVCSDHYKEGLCPYCREKLGKKTKK